MTQPPDDPEIEVSTEHTAAALASGDAQVIDVRETYEREAGYIAGSRHIELDQLASEAQTIDRERPVIFQCHMGSRSLMAAQAFRRAGYDAWSMAGGLERWAGEGRALETTKGPQRGPLE
ncbi:MAG TPA: rhodanese-like domain-containing protein [Solirubrobacteraceae bacterium]